MEGSKNSIETDEVYTTKEDLGIVAYGGMIILALIMIDAILYFGEDGPSESEYKSYTQEVLEINTEDNKLLVGNGEEISMSNSQFKNLNVNDIITYEKAEGYKKVENVKIVGNAR